MGVTPYFAEAMLKFAKQKTHPKMCRICYPDLVRLVDYRWNQIYDSSMLMYEKLDRFRLADYISQPELEGGDRL